ncbi:MAG: agmatinase family protein [Hyphomonadaceae bacterium]
MTSECRSWTSLADLITDDASAPVALLGAPLSERSLTPGRCDLGPRVFRQTLPRLSVYDLETETDLAHLRVFDAGDLNLKLVEPSQALTPIKEKTLALAKPGRLLAVIGGNNAITRPIAHGLSLSNVGVVTLDAHFDLRDTDCGLNNGNPIQALLEDGVPGDRIAQIGLAPFANTKKMHQKAKDAGINVLTQADVRKHGIARCVADALAFVSKRADVILVDFDIDVIDRAHLPGAPGARPGGISPQDFFDAARLIGAHPKVAAVDLTEFDPSLDVADISALTAARWFAELLAGFQTR